MAAAAKERVWAEADKLDAEGKKPTYSAIRKALGGGSFSTISDALIERKAKLAARERTAAVEPAPETLAVLLSDFGAQVWALALDVAGKRFVADREALETVRVELETEKAEAIEAADETAAELETAKEQIAALEATELAARKDTETAKAQVAGISERATIAEARALEIEKRAADLNAELERLHQANGDLVKALAAAAGSKEKETA